MKKTKLFCIPYAGGSSQVFSSWKNHLKENIHLEPIELCGRGKRIHEPNYRSISEAVDDIYNIIKSKILEGPYAVFGHSMGAMLTNELLLKIEETGLPRPRHVFFSGRGAPSIKSKKEKNYHLLDDKNFIKKLKELGGTPKEFFTQPELLDLFLPLLRSDFRLASEDFSSREIKPINCDITVLLGKDEEISAKQADGWKHHTKGICKLHYFNGGHFFLNDEVCQITKLIGKELTAHKEPELAQKANSFY